MKSGMKQALLQIFFFVTTELAAHTGNISLQAHKLYHGSEFSTVPSVSLKYEKWVCFGIS